MVYIYVYHTIYAHWNFGTWNCWNANLSNGFYMVYPTIYWGSNFGTWNFWNTNLSNGLYICCIILYMHIEILELGTVGTQI